MAVRKPIDQIVWKSFVQPKRFHREFYRENSSVVGLTVPVLQQVFGAIRIRLASHVLPQDINPHISSELAVATN